MAKMRIVVQHQIEQVVTLNVPEDELVDMTYEDALANAQFDEMAGMFVTTSEIEEITIDGKEHYF